MSRLLEFVATRAWSMERHTFDKMWAILMRHSQGEKLPSEEIQAIQAERRASHPSQRRHDGLEVVNGVGIVPVTGVIARHASQVNGISSPSGTAVETIRRNVRSLVKDDQVSAILLDIDSPGGVVDGVPELADELHKVDAQDKPVYALADGMAASAAYWLAAQARSVFTTRSSQVGSIGVYAVIDDYSQMAERLGIKVNVLRFGEHKGRIVDGQAVEDETLSLIQEEVNAYGEMFVEAIARGRRITAEKARELANGLSHVGSKAQKLGLADGVKTFEEVIEEISSESGGSGSSAGRAAHAQESQGGSAMAEQPGKDSDAGKAKATSPTDVSRLTAEELKEANPALYDSVAKSAAETERKRVSAIREMACRGQEQLVERLISEGANEDQARKELHDDLRTNGMKARRKTMEPMGGDPNEGLVEESQTVEATDDGDPEEAFLKACTADWAAMPFAERRAFGNSAERYIAFQRGQREGKITIRRGSSVGRN